MAPLSMQGCQHIKRLPPADGLPHRLHIGFNAVKPALLAVKQHPLIPVVKAHIGVFHHKGAVALDNV